VIHILGIDPHLAQYLQFMSEDVEQDLRIRGGVDMAQILPIEILLQLLGIGQVSVMSQGDSIGGVDVERLRLRRRGATSGRVTHMTDAAVTPQIDHVPGTEHILHQTIALAQMEALSVLGNDARRILPAMLKYQQRVVYGLIYRALPEDSDDTTHYQALQIST
jgi:hypothetical protein